MARGQRRRFTGTRHVRGITRERMGLGGEELTTKFQEVAGLELETFRRHLDCECGEKM